MLFGRLALLHLIICVSITLLASCQKTPASHERSSPSLMINTSFDVNQLPTEARLWSDRLRAQIENPQQFPNATEMASSNDTYIYGRALNTHITSLLQVLRVTGDRRLLDEIDRLAQLMRAELKDWSILKFQGDTYATDGYLNWQYFHDSGYHGSDVHQMDEMLAHSLVAAMTYAFYVNRNVDPRFAERAKFWTDYLQHHFEAKWRARKSNPASFPFLSVGLSHVQMQWIRYHYYMYMLTGERGYYDEALRMAAIMKRHFRAVSTPLGIALQWTHGIPEMNEDELGAQKIVYARYTAQAAADLALEGFSFFGQDGFMEQMSCMLAVFIMDTDIPDSFALRNDGSGDEREKISRYAYSPFAQLGYWDNSGRVLKVSIMVYDRFEENPAMPRCLHIPAGVLFSLMKPKKILPVAYIDHDQPFRAGAI